MIDLSTTIHYDQMMDGVNEGKRILLFQGGTRSGKTFNLCVGLVSLCMQTKVMVDITRRTLPSLKATVLRDLLSVLNMFGIDFHWNKTDRIIGIGDSEIAYYSLDEEEKIRGRKRDIMFVNELTEINYDLVKQILFRTPGCIIADYNPSISGSHYIHDLVKRDDCVLYKSTYKDNPFLEDSIVREIESLRETDPWMWAVFGLGEVMIPRSLIYNVDEVEEIPVDEKGYRIPKFLGYGMDVGFQDPTVLVALYLDGLNLYIDEILHEKHLTDPDVVSRFDALGVDKSLYVVSDISPGLHALLRQSGYRIKTADKLSVLEGIRKLKTVKILVTKRSENVINDLRLYKWKEDVNGNATDVPLHKFSHSPDAIRYGFKSLATAGHYSYR